MKFVRVFTLKDNLMAEKRIHGIHHVTAMSSGAQKNVDFYAGILGLRMVKKTINFDAPNVYHLYYGDGAGNPGTIMTFFPFPNMRPGAQGKGQVVTTSFSIPEHSVDYWLGRLDRFAIAHKAPQERFEEVVIYLEDHDGLGLELVANAQDEREVGEYGPVPADHAVKGFFGVELLQDTYERTEALLVNHMDHRLIAEAGNRRRYAPDNAPGKFVDIIWNAQAQYGSGGTGTVHHVAFRTPSDEAQLAIRDQLIQAGVQPTPVMDRNYFHSIYYREPGGVLFEIATDPPGFMVDEPEDSLGNALKLPEWYEPRREEIARGLEPIAFDVNAFR